MCILQFQSEARAHYVVRKNYIIGLFFKKKKRQKNEHKVKK